MSKPKNGAGAPQDMMSNPFAISDAAERAGALLNLQAAAGERVRDFADRWWDRRREAANAAAACCADLFANTADPAAAGKVWTAWVADAAQRVRADVSEQAALATDLMSLWSGAGAAPKRRTKVEAAVGGARHAARHDLPEA